MTDMTAEQALAEYIEGTGIRRGNEWESGFLHGYGEGLHQALTAPRVPNGGQKIGYLYAKAAFCGTRPDLGFTLEFCYYKGAGRVKKYLPNKPYADENGEVFIGDLYLTTDPAPADITLETDLSKMSADYPGAVDWTGSSAEPAPAERNNIGASFSKMPPYEYQRQVSSGDGRIAATIVPAPAEPAQDELAKLREMVKELEEQWAVVFDGHAVMQHMEAANQYAHPPLICATLDAVAAIGKERAARLRGGGNK